MRGQRKGRIDEFFLEFKGKAAKAILGPTTVLEPLARLRPSTDSDRRTRIP